MIALCENNVHDIMTTMMYPFEAALPPRWACLALQPVLRRAANQRRTPSLPRTHADRDHLGWVRSVRSSQIGWESVPHPQALSWLPRPPRVGSACTLWPRRPRRPRAPYRRPAGDGITGQSAEANTYIYSFSSSTPPSTPLSPPIQGAGASRPVAAQKKWSLWGRQRRGRRRLRWVWGSWWRRVWSCWGWPLLMQGVLRALPEQCGGASKKYTFRKVSQIVFS